MKNRFMAMVLIIFLIAILLILTNCVNGGAISSKSYRFSKGVTGKAAEPVVNDDAPFDPSRAGQQSSDAKSG